MARESIDTDGAETVTIDTLGHRGDGVATTPRGPLYVPYTLAGETVQIRRHGARADLVAVTTPSPDRVDPSCRHFGACGGCSLQHMALSAYRIWKRDQVIAALEQRGLTAPVSDTHPIGPGARRRAVLAATRTQSGAVLGFHKRQSHAIIDLAECPVLDPRIVQALEVLRRLAKTACPRRGQMTLTVLATSTGLDVALTDTAPLSNDLRQRLVRVAIETGIARLSVGDEVVIETRPPVLDIAGAAVTPPPGGFAQAAASSEEALAARVLSATKGAKRVADLFCGFGTFALRLARHAAVHAVEADAAALAALEAAMRHTSGLKPISLERRDLFRRPLMAKELAPFDAVVFDPPRAGAKEQAEMLAASTVPTVVAVSCNPATLARDLRLIVDGGYALQSVHPVDQFLWSPHIEVVAILRRS